MRLHTKLTADDIYTALADAKSKGRTTHDVQFDPIVAHNSRTHLRAYEIQLGALNGNALPAGYTNQYGKRQKCRRVRNGNYTRDLRFAATWHEWGWFVAEVYKADPNARWGPNATAANLWGLGTYQSRADFNSKTDFKFR